MSDRRMDQVRQRVAVLLENRELADLGDSQLLERYVRERDETAFAVLLRRHGPMVLGVCRNILRHAHDAEDAFQATFLVLACKANQIRRQTSLASWLYGTASRVSLKARSRLAALRCDQRHLADRRRAEAQREAAQRVQEQQALRDWLHEELSRLPEWERQVLILCYLEGRTQEQAARALGCPVGSISRHVKRAAELLQERLAGQGFALSVPAVLAVLAEQARAALPDRLSRITLQTVYETTAAGTLAPGAAGAGIVLAREVLESMTRFKLSALAAVLMLTGVIAATTGLVAQPLEKAKGPGPKASARAKPGLEPFRQRSPEDRLRLIEKLVQADQPFQKAERGAVTQTVVERATVEPAAVSEVVWRNEQARPIKWVIEEGSHVKKGVRVLELHTGDFQGELNLLMNRKEKVEDDFAQARENLTLMQAENQVDIRLAEIAVRIAELEANKLKGDVDKTIATLKAEQARLLLGRVKAQSKGREARAEADLRSKKVVLDRDKTRQQVIEDQIRKCTLTAPREGVVLYSFPWNPEEINRGAIAQPNQILLRIYDPNHLQVNARIPEALISQIRAGQPAVVQVDAFPNRPIPAEVVKVATAASHQDWFKSGVKVYSVELALKEMLLSLKPGMTAEASIQTGEQRAVLRVPIQAVLGDSKSRYCFVRTSKGIEQRPVVTGLQGNSFVEIKEGLQEGDQVLRDPRAVAERLDLGAREGSRPRE